MAGLPLGFARKGDWLVSDRYGIARVSTYFGTNYCVHSLDYPSDIDATLIGVRQALAEAVRLVEVKS